MDVFENYCHDLGHLVLEMALEAKQDYVSKETDFAAGYMAGSIASCLSCSSNAQRSASHWKRSDLMGLIRIKTSSESEQPVCPLASGAG
jgi:hypothetical protein